MDPMPIVGITIEVGARLYDAREPRIYLNLRVSHRGNDEETYP
jgi:hypothetical protein